MHPSPTIPVTTRQTSVARCKALMGERRRLEQQLADVNQELHQIEDELDAPTAVVAPPGWMGPMLIAAGVCGLILMLFL